MTGAIHKVTCFITRSGQQGPELLLFRHANAGVQVPAGTVDPDEETEAAAIREAAEESGLVGLRLIRKLGEVNDPPRVGRLIVTQPTIVYSHPSTGSIDWVHFRPGIEVESLRHEAGFTQIHYEEADQLNDPQYTTFSITGWVPDEALTSNRIRHFFLFEAPFSTPERWQVTTDKHTFELFWAPMGGLPLIIPPQDEWINFLVSSL
jgi:8-oxo-dGTP pyrophosphatase MutT (NUDIX family)